MRISIRAGDRMVTSSFDKTARMWNVADGSQIAILKGHQGAVERAMFSPDGSRVVTAAATAPREFGMLLQASRFSSFTSLARFTPRYSAPTVHAC